MVSDSREGECPGGSGAKRKTEGKVIPVTMDLRLSRGLPKPPGSLMYENGQRTSVMKRGTFIGCTPGVMVTR